MIPVLAVAEKNTKNAAVKTDAPVKSLEVRTSPERRKIGFFDFLRVYQRLKTAA